MRTALLLLLGSMSLLSRSSADGIAVDIVFADGSTAQVCDLWDYTPTDVPDFVNLKEEVAVCGSLDAAKNHETNRSRLIPYSRLKRIDVLHMSAAELQLVKTMHPDDRDKLIKCDITFQDGKTMKAMFLLPYTKMSYRCPNERGTVQRDTVRAIVFRAPASKPR